MLYVVAVILALVVLFGPAYWVSYVYKKYSKTIPDCPGTGGELAEHLLAQQNITDVQVVRGKDVDYYDLKKCQVVLSKTVYDGKSITAIAVAAHEVGHAIQHIEGFTPLLISGKWAGIIDMMQRGIMQIMLITSSVAALLVHAPVYRMVFIAGILIALAKVALNFATLPAELDASFKKAMPMLSNGLLPEHYMRPAKVILKAAAFTYVAKALSDVINIFKWFILFRR